MSKKRLKDEKEPPKYATGGQVVGNALGGALAGAGTGAALGSVVPGIGTAIGAIGGGLVGGVGSLLGSLGSQNSSAQFTSGVNPADIQNANQNVQQSFGSQQALADALGQSGGIGNQQNVFGQQQALANQLAAMSQGAGPNPAAAALQQATNQNIAEAAGLVSSQKGINPALAARLAGQQAGQLNQQAANQSALMRAQQQLSAVGALQQQQGMLGGLANQQIANQMQAQNAVNNLALGQQQNVLGANQAANANALGANAQNINQNQFNQQQSNQYLGAGLNAAGSVLGSGILSRPSSPVANPGTALGYGAKTISSNPNSTPGNYATLAEGGEVSPQMGSNAILKENYSGPKSILAKRLKGYANGGKVEALVSPGEIYLSPKQANKVLAGEANPLDGEKIPGKAKVGGAKNSYANDTVEKDLQVGGVVLPRSVTQSKDPSESAKKFVEALKAKKSSK